MRAAPGPQARLGDPAKDDAAAIAALRKEAEVRGYRVREIRWDPVLRRCWAVLESVGHPERPYLSELTDLHGQVSAAIVAQAGDAAGASQLPAVPTPILVHFGDRVRLWRSETNVRMEMGAVAEGNAAAGERVTLRVIGAGSNGQTGWRVTGVVRGLGSVEME